VVLLVSVANSCTNSIIAHACHWAQVAFGGRQFILKSKTVAQDAAGRAVLPRLMVAGALSRLSQAELKAALSVPPATASASTIRAREAALSALFRSTPLLDDLLG